MEENNVQVQSVEVAPTEGTQEGLVSNPEGSTMTDVAAGALSAGLVAAVTYGAVKGAKALKKAAPTIKEHLAVAKEHRTEVKNLKKEQKEALKKLKEGWKPKKEADPKDPDKDKKE